MSKHWKPLAEAAEIVGVSTRTLRRWLDSWDEAAEASPDTTEAPRLGPPAPGGSPPRWVVHVPSLKRLLAHPSSALALRTRAGASG